MNQIASVLPVLLTVAWLTPLASFGLLCTMAVATYTHMVAMGDPFVGSREHPSSYEPALMYFCVSFLFLVAGPGRFSLDRLIFGKNANGNE